MIALGVINGRYTARTDEPFVVFIIGMRINNLFAVRRWLPTVRAMGPMLRELYRHPEKGFLGAEFFLYWRGPAIVQYWRSFEDLERFARNPTRPTSWNGGTSRRSTPTCLYSDSPRPPSTSGRSGVGRPRGGA